MTKGSFIVECPCCQGKLTIDPEVRAVIAHEAPPPKSQKGKVLDRKFQEGLKRAKDSPDPPRRPFDLD